MSASRGKGVLLVGAGFLGKFFVQKWLQNPYNKIIVMDKVRKGDFFNHPLLAPYKNDNRIKYVWGSSGDPQQLEKYFKAGEIDDIVYTAAIADVPYAATNPRDTQIVNVDNLRLFLEYVGTQVFGGFKGKVVLMSSESVYKSKKCLPVADYPEADIAFKEDDELEAHSVYGRSKVDQEQVARRACKTYNLNLTIIRSATMYGMFARAEQVIPTFIRQILEKKPITLYGDGTSTSRDFVHVTDTVNGIVSILNAPRSVTKGETFNIGSGRETFLLNLANGMKTILNQPSEAFDPRKGIPNTGYIPITFLDFLPGEEGARMVLNIDKAKSKLLMTGRDGKPTPWEPQVALMEGLKSTIFWTCSVIGYDEKEMEEIERFIYPERFKGRTEQNPMGFRAK